MGIPVRGLRPEGSRFRIDIKKIAPNPRNPRDDDDWMGQEFEAFADNLENVGTIHDPVLCTLGTYLDKYPQYTSELQTEYPEAEFVLLAGEGRWRAHLAKGAEEMAVVLRNSLLEQGDFIFMSENGRRRNLNPIQEGLLCWRAHHEDGLSYEEIARRGGMSGGKSRVAKLIALYDRFPDGPAREAVRSGKLPAEGAYHLLTSLKDHSLIEQAYKLMESESLTARQAVKAMMGITTSPTPPEAEPPAGPADGPVPATGGEEPSGSASSEEPVSPAKPSEPQRKEGSKQEGGPAGDDAAGDLGDAVPPNPSPNSQPDATKDRTPASDPQVSPAKPRRRTGEAAARVAALQRTLADRDYSNPDDITVRLAAVVLTTARQEQRQIAATAAALSPADVADLDELAGRNSADLVRLADAAAFAAAELCLRTQLATDWTPREADYLRRLVDAGYEPTAEENDFLSVSPAKLPTPAEATT
ncbi:hypothetical protein ETD86_12995 [Nonomuraea turkmeniaca]|uniref:ParB/Sulfiredoxin domain-containing protein n=1 Tax=Nonomuraea turkmeniaca TaxID=103838 RepID=A0A5S4FN74_9ACTN|nr:ParB/RepB/Spo0J family partition protein [Nonomuraea turkmeniaca]TMR22079.1 hypothetical protein ETD86_12995 [Nonomuraea turkmeniaca]